MDNAIVQETNTQDIAIAQEIKQLVSKGVSENTLRRYAFWQREIDAWRGERVLNDALMAAFVTIPYAVYPICVIHHVPCVSNLTNA